jgi:hypothetical protein
VFGNTPERCLFRESALNGLVAEHFTRPFFLSNSDLFRAFLPLIQPVLHALGVEHDVIPTPGTPWAVTPAPEPGSNTRWIPDQVRDDGEVTL